MPEDGGSKYHEKHRPTKSSDHRCYERNKDRGIAFKRWKDWSSEIVTFVPSLSFKEKFNMYCIYIDRYILYMIIWYMNMYINIWYGASGSSSFAKSNFVSSSGTAASQTDQTS